MPGFKTHCAISKKRTNYGFSELHRWIDDPSKKRGMNHRTERHSFNETDAKKIKEYWDNKKGRGWGQKAVIEWLFHIAIDNLHTAFKWSNKSFSYGENAYNFMEFELNRSGFIHCNFERMDERDMSDMFDDDYLEKDYYEEGFISSIFRKIFG
jgi:hypothetical protein